MTAQNVELVTTSVAATPSRSRAAAPASLPAYRVNLMRLGYGLMAFGLAATPRGLGHD
jgi:hypothetical protein